MGMQVTQGGLAKSSVFSVIEKPEYISGIYRSENSDKLEISSKPQIKKSNKNKLIIGGIIASAVLIGAVVFRKNISALFPKKVNNNIDTAPIVNSGESIQDKLIQNARRFLIDDVKNHGEPSANGICFYGPNSLGKENAIESFVSDLSDAGYQIKRVPRLKDGNISEIRKSIEEFIIGAEELFKNTNQRTAIVVRDLDKIARDRELYPKDNLTKVLLRTENCRKRGFCWISEAENINLVDSALVRWGRTDSYIISKPDLSEPKSLWEKYIDVIKSFNIGEKKDELLREAQEIIKSKMN